MISSDSSLKDILEHVWGMLGRGGADARHPYHFPALATYGPQGIQQRTVVLRKVDQASRQFHCYSDYRTQKLKDLKQHANAHWLFYDHGSKEQIRVKVQIRWHHQDEEAREVWQDIPPKNRADYIGPVPPGTHSERYTSNLPEEFQQGPSEQNTRHGFENFVLMISEVQELDFLKLQKDGHLRAQFKWQGKQWKKYWIAP
uniref:Pyridoxamine 5'-phosphate oxidase family protein n=1 Tax=Roseihalotalea indica TaxID=2867963 RepID=A0AA49GNG2_9BACT|nr:pyridoxamine 5'-phosphate oxidase family protein [Tunicatimonas sp. TK19036]